MYGNTNINYLKCGVCDQEAVQWFAAYTDEKLGGKFATVWCRCKFHQRSKEVKNIINGNFLTKDEVTVLSVMEDAPKRFI